MEKADLRGSEGEGADILERQAPGGAGYAVCLANSLLAWVRSLEKRLSHFYPCTKNQTKPNKAKQSKAKKLVLGTEVVKSLGILV